MLELPAPKPSVWPAAAEICACAPGLVLSTAVAVTAFLAAPLIGRVLPIPAMVIALFIGIALNALAARPAFQPGIVFCVKVMLRRAAALLGLRIALGDVVALGASTALLVVLATALTVLSGFWLARAFGQSDYYGALAGAGTAVCGASATLATARKASVPGFALVFLALCIANSVLSATPAAASVYLPVKDWLGQISTWGLLIAIGALGLGTSISAVAALGWRHIATVTGTTLVILVTVTVALMIAR